MTREAICREVKFSKLEIPKILQIVPGLFIQSRVSEYLTYADSFTYSLLVLVKLAFCKDLVYKFNSFQGRKHQENFGATPPMVGRICPPWLE